MASFYLVLCVVGVIVPYGFFLPWLFDHGLDLPLFITELLSARIGAFFGADVIVAAVALFGFVAADGRRAGVKGLWAPVLGTICIGVSLGLPLFLYLRERSAPVPGVEERSGGIRPGRLPRRQRRVSSPSRR